MLLHPLDYADVSKSQSSATFEHQSDLLSSCGCRRRRRRLLRRGGCLLVVLLCDCRDAQRSDCAHQSQNEAAAKCKIQHTITCVRVGLCLFRNSAVPSGFYEGLLARTSILRSLRPVSPRPYPKWQLPVSVCIAKKRRPAGRLIPKYVLASDFENHWHDERSPTCALLNEPLQVSSDLLFDDSVVGLFFTR